MYWIWDVLVIAIMAVCVWLAYRKGLIATLFNLLSTVLAFLGALAFKGVVGAWIDTAFVRTPVRNMVLSTLSGSPVLKYEEALADLDVASKLRQMPQALVTLLEKAGLSSEEIIAKMGGASAKTLEAKNQLIDSIAAPISATISTAIAFVVLFIVLLVVCFLASKVLSALLNLLPVGKQFNRIGGALIGVVEGALIVLIVSAVVWAISLGVNEGFCSPEAIDKTWVMGRVIDVNPICGIFR